MPQRKEKQSDHAINQQFVACTACDALCDRPKLKTGQIAKCGRCHGVMLTNKVGSVDRVLAATIGALVLLATALTFPFLTLERAGLSNQISVLDSVFILWDGGMESLAIAASLFIVLLPLARTVILLFIFAQLRRGKRLNWRGAALLRLSQDIEPWAMTEIFMIGVVVSLVKIGKLASVSLGPAFWALAALMLLMTYTTTAMCRDTAWAAVQTRHP